MTAYTGERKMSADEVIASREELRRAVEKKLSEVISAVSRAAISEVQAVSSKKLVARKVTQLDAQQIVQGVIGRIRWVDDEPEQEG